MKAVIAEAYGGPEVLRYTDWPDPVVREKDILVKVRAATVTLGDCELRAFRFADWIWLPLRLAMGVFKPRQPVLGAEFAGEVVAIGSAVDTFAVGDRVFGSGSFAMACYAQLKRTPADGPVTKIPDGVDYAQAAGIPVGGLNGLHFVRHADVAAGEKVLINGAGGAIGTFAVQFAKLRGAQVTAVDRAEKLDMLTKLGADHVVDYAREDITRSADRYDVIIDVVGKIPSRRGLDLLNPGGRLFNGNPRFKHFMAGLFVKKPEGKKMLFQLAGEPIEDLDQIAGQIAQGEIRTVIDRHMALEQMDDAHRYVDGGHKKGVLVIDVPQDD